MSFLSMADDYITMNESVNPFSNSTARFMMSGVQNDNIKLQQSINNSQKLHISQTMDQPEVDIKEIEPHIIQSSVDYKPQETAGSYNTAQTHYSFNQDQPEQQSDKQTVFGGENMLNQQTTTQQMIQQLQNLSPNQFARQKELEQMQNKIDLNQLQISKIITTTQSQNNNPLEADIIDNETKMKLLHERFSKFQIKNQNKPIQQTEIQNTVQLQQNNDDYTANNNILNINQNYNANNFNTMTSQREYQRSLQTPTVQQSILDINRTLEPVNNIYTQPVNISIQTEQHKEQVNDNVYQILMSQQELIQQLRQNIQQNESDIVQIHHKLQCGQIQQVQIPTQAPKQQFLNENNENYFGQIPDIQVLSEIKTQRDEQTTPFQDYNFSKPMVTETQIIQTGKVPLFTDFPKQRKIPVAFNIPFSFKHKYYTNDLQSDKQQKLMNYKLNSQDLDDFVIQCKQKQFSQQEINQSLDQQQNEKVKEDINVQSVDQQDETKELNCKQCRQHLLQKIKIIESQWDEIINKQMNIMKQLIFEQQNEDDTKNVKERIHTLIEEYNKIIQQQATKQQDDSVDKTKDENVIKCLRKNKKYEKLKQGRLQQSLTSSQIDIIEQLSVSSLKLYYIIVKQQNIFEKKLLRQKHRNLCFDELTGDINENDVQTLKVHVSDQQQTLQQPISRYQLVNLNNILKDIGLSDF